MITSATNDLFYSFGLYLDHQILQKGQGYTNHASLLYPQVDNALPNKTIYASPFKQWNFDYSVSGSNIPSGVYSNGSFCNKGISGLMIDYLNGRVIFSGGNAYQNLQVSGNYSIKSFNIYPTTKSDEELVFETKYQLNPSYSKSLSGISKDALVIPGIFINNLNVENEALAFGGICESVVNIHAVILADSKDQLDAIGSLLADEKYSYFPVITKTPLNYYGDYKSGNYNYLSYIGAPTGQNLAYIADASFYRLSSKEFSNKYPDLKCGFADFHCRLVRVPNRSIF